MPEFHIPIGSTNGAIDFNALDKFTQGYVEAAYFTKTGTADDAEDGLENASFEDLHPDALAEMVKECKAFQERYADLLSKAYAMTTDRGHDYDAEAAGRDLWFTRNGHGVGFWDRGLGDVGDALAEACGWRTDFPERTLYMGDDMRVHICEA